MTFQARAIATTQRLLVKYGKLGRVTISRDTAGVEDPVAGEITGADPVETALLSATHPVRESLIDGERIVSTDIAFTCDNAFEPKMSDTVLIESRKYKIVRIIPLDANGTVISYEVICRG